MKASIKTGMLLIGLISSSCSDNLTPQEAYAPQPATMDVFYNQLSPYGSWVNYANYGYVWIPEVPWGFNPYFTNGHWIYTRFGWTWHSYYPWGWATFHYGRWIFDIAYGWIWVPDIVWGPAWVAWRNGPGYYGWAPLSPGLTVNVVLFGDYAIPHEHWCFVKEVDFYDNHLEHHRVDRSQNASMINRSSLIRNVHEERNEQYMAGPSWNDIQRATQKPINQVEIKERNRPGAEKLKDNQLQVFKPFINRDGDSQTSRAPQRVFKLEEINKRSDSGTFRNQGQLKIPARPSIQTRPSIQNKKSPQQKIQVKPPVRENRSQPGKRITPSNKSTSPRKKRN